MTDNPYRGVIESLDSMIERTERTRQELAQGFQDIISEIDTIQQKLSENAV